MINFRHNHIRFCLNNNTYYFHDFWQDTHFGLSLHGIPSGFAGQIESQMTNCIDFEGEDALSIFILSDGILKPVKDSYLANSKFFLEPNLLTH